MILGLVAAGIFVAGMIVLSLFLRRRDEEGHWSKEGHGATRDDEPGPRFRPLQTPPSEPFD